MIINNDFEKNLHILKENNRKLSKLKFNDILGVFDRLYYLWKDKDGDYYKKALEKMPSIVGFSENMVKDGLDVICEIIKPENIFYNITKSIENHKYLDEFVYSFDNGIHSRFRSLGVVAHISASNVFISCVDSLVSGLITKNSNIIKMPRKDRFFPELFIESIKECDIQGILSDNIQLWDFTSKDKHVEKILKDKCDGIVVWGGEEAVMAYRKDLSLHTRLIEYGPKYSFSVIFRDHLLEQIVSNTAMDIVMWEQAACSSPHIIFVKKDFAEKFAQMLSLELEKLETYYPSPELDLDTKTEILKFREENLMNSVINEVDKVYKVNGSNSTVVLKHDNSFEITCQNRNIFVKVFENEDDVLENISVLGRNIQTVALWTDRKHLFEFSEKLSEKGVYRITSPGFMFQGKNGVPHDGSFPLRRLGEFIHIENVSIDRFTEICEFARDNTEFYKDRDMNIPLTREELFENSPPFNRTMISDDNLNGFIFSSGGTTGRPKYALYSAEDFDIMTDILADIYRAGGIKEGDRVANTFIAGNLWTSFLVANEALKKIGCTNYPIAGNSDFELIDSYLEKFNINAVIGLPSIIIKMAEICEEHGLNINIDTILYGGEHFYKGAKEYVCKVWNTKKIASAGYAAVDTGPVGYQCDHLDGSLHHVCEEFVKVELVDEKGNYITDYDIPGEIVVTNINRYKMPIIRFRTGDLGVFRNIDCDCEFTGVTFELLGRCDDVIIAGSTNIELGSFDATVSEFKELSSIWQVIVTTENSKDKVVLKIEYKEKNPVTKVKKEDIIKSLFSHAKNIQKTNQSGWLDFDVEIVNNGDIERVERTGKVKKVLDLRKT